MEKLMKFENSNIQMIEIDGVWYFDLYSVGMALGQTVKAKGVIYANKARIDKNAENAEIKPVLRNAKPYITEEQIYDLMLETRTDKCKAFRKWLSNEVLPALNHEGTYSMPDKQYEYFGKTYKGEPVLNTADIVHLTGISRWSIIDYIKEYLKLDTDYYCVKGDTLRKYKSENPKVVKTTNFSYLLTKSGFIKFCKAYGIKVETPQCFESKPVQLELKEDKSDGSISEILNKAQAREIFDKECVLLFGENVILYATVAKLFGKEAAESSKSDSFAKRPSGSPVGGYNRMGSKNYDFAFFYLEGFYRAVTYSNAKKIRKNLYNVNI